jgi:hypothetical protein
MLEMLLAGRRSAGDPFWDNTLFLSHFDGAHLSKSFIDEKKHAMTAYGNASLYGIGVPRFGNASLAANGGYVDVAGTDLTFPGDFTMEGWFWFASFSSSVNTGLIAHARYAEEGNGNFLIRTGYGNSDIQWASYNGYWGGSSSNAAIIAGKVPGGITTGNWHHVAVTRKDGTLRIFFNGKLLVSGVDTKVLNPGGAFPIRIGGGGSPHVKAIDGNADEIRLTNICRYTADFVVPAKAFPNFK